MQANSFDQRCGVVGATHSTSINAGLDQEMPGSSHMGDALAAQVKSGKVTMDKVNDSTLRILTPMFQMGLFDEPWISNNGSLSNNVTSEEHNKLARSIAAEGMVLLKNDGGILPIGASTKKIAETLNILLGVYGGCS